MFNILIIDDEKPARDRLRRLVNAIPDYRVAGEAANGSEALERIRELSPDILLLTDIDFDHSAAALTALSQALINPYPYQFTTRPNAGVQTGLDLDANGYLGDARDAMGYGRFLGDGGLAIGLTLAIRWRSVIRIESDTESGLP